MRFSVALTCATLALLASPALAKEKKPVDPDKKICRTEDTTGSIMPSKRVCHTKQEWATIDQENAQQTDQYHNAREQSR